MNTLQDWIAVKKLSPLHSCQKISQVIGSIHLFYISKRQIGFLCNDEVL